MFQPMTWSGRPARWLWITAFFELALAVFFFFMGMQNEIIRGGFYLTAAILGGTALLLMLWASRMSKGYAEAERLRMQGVSGQATVVGLRQTGMYMNEQPQVELQLQVQTEMHGTYPVTVKEWVPLIMLGRLSSGMPLPVKVDPSNQNKVLIDWQSSLSAPGAAGAPMVGMAGAPMGGMAGMQGAPAMSPSGAGGADQKKRLLEGGVPGKATVMKSSPTDLTDAEGRKVYDLVLSVEIPGYPPMQAPARVGIPPERLDQLEEGDTVPVKADPTNPSMMAVDWENA